MSYRIGVIADKVLHCRSTDFGYFCSCDLDLESMTFILYELDLYFVLIYRICEYELYT